MPYAIAKKTSTNECYNNIFTVLSLHESFDKAYKASVDMDSIIQVTDSIQRFDQINADGGSWKSAYDTK